MEKWDWFPGSAGIKLTGIGGLIRISYIVCRPPEADKYIVCR